MTTKHQITVTAEDIERVRRSWPLRIKAGPAVDTVPSDCDSIMILRCGRVAEIRPILTEYTEARYVEGVSDEMGG